MALEVVSDRQSTLSSTCRAVAMTFEVVRLGLTCACMNYSASEVRVLGGSGRKFRISGLLKLSLMRFLSNMLRISYGVRPAVTRPEHTCAAT